MVAFATACSSGETPADETSDRATTQSSAPVQTTTSPAAPTTTADPVLRPNGPMGESDNLTIQVVGECSSNNGTGMRLLSTGFTPNGEYQTTATYPDGKEYTYLKNHGLGRANDKGETPGWEWNCQAGPGGQTDPPGEYRLRLQDLTTQEVVDTTFMVNY